MRLTFSLLSLVIILFQCQQAFSASFPFGKALTHETENLAFDITIEKVEDEYVARGEVRLTGNYDFRKWRTSHLRLLLFYNNEIVDKIYIPVSRISGRTLFFEKRFATKYTFDQISLYTNLGIQVN